MIAVLFAPVSAFCTEELSALKAEIENLRNEYEQRIKELEDRLAEMEAATREVPAETATVGTIPAPVTKTTNSFNPAISLILNGQYNHYTRPASEYTLSGFALQGEGGLAREGFSLGESEMTLSASIDPLFFGQVTMALADEGGITEVNIEEAFIETIGLNNGVTVRAGRFYSPIGYLNEKHVHTWNFSDAPLIYRGLFGDQLINDGLKISYLLPTDILFEVGATVGSGSHYPGSGEHSGIGDWLLYARAGGDIGIEDSWQLGLAHWRANPEDRSFGNSGDVVFNGSSDITSLSLVYKWAANGNIRDHSFTLQNEYFYQHESGTLDEGNRSSAYDGKQYGSTIEGIYQFSPRWRTGFRYDWLGSRHHATDLQLLRNAALDFSEFHPQRYSLMLEWLPSEFSRLRLQLNEDKSSHLSNTELFLQYTVSLGSHGAHAY